MADEIKIPIVLGVTGHRQIPPNARDTICAAFESILDGFRQAYPGTSLVLLSSLAEGADQLCAEIALANNLRVIAPLPFSRGSYRASSSFPTKEGQKKLDDLLAHDLVESFIAPLPDDVNPSDEAAWTKLRDNEETRRQCYANAGGYVALHCHVLIALWDGKASSHPAGTFEVVRFKLTGEPPRLYPWTQPLLQWADTGPVYVIPTPRNAEEGAAIPQTPQASIQHLYPGVDLANVSEQLQLSAQEQSQQAAEKVQFADICRRIAEFNSIVEKQSLADRSEETSANDEVVPAIEQRLTWLQRVRASAGQIAQRNRAWTDRLSLTLFLLLLAALVCFHLYAHFFELTADHAKHEPLFLVLFLLLLLGVFGIVLWERRGHFERKWLDCRSLAEALRVQLHWCRAGVNAAVASNYLLQVRSELSWVRRAVRACSPPHHLCREAFWKLDPAKQQAALEKVRSEWVESQTTFFAKFHQIHRRELWLRRAGLSLAFIGWLLSLLLLYRAEHPWHWLLILSSSLVVAGGLVIAYKEKQFLEELARQYERMHILFTFANQALVKQIQSSDLKAAQQLLEELGREALSENASWLLLHRARPFELPIHG